jgi:integrase
MEKMLGTAREGWWSKHEYPKRRIVEDITEFCGWDTLNNIFRACEKLPYDTWRIKHRNRDFIIARDKSLIATAFLTGGRINEVLDLKPSNFDTESNGEYIIVTNMLLEKVYTYEQLKDPVFVTPNELATMDDTRHFKLENILGDEVYVKRWETRRNVAQSVRKPFPIFKSDPFVLLLKQWIDLYKEYDDYLFASTDIRREGKPITSTRAYQIITSVGRISGVDIFPHWFRAQRASQLFKEWNLSWEELKLWFSWRTDAMAEKYARFSVDDLAARMLHKRSLIR